MILRSLLVGAALGAGGLVSMETGLHAVHAQQLRIATHTCESPPGCLPAADPIDVYANSINSAAALHETIPKSAVALIGLGAVATIGGTVALAEASYRQMRTPWMTDEPYCGNSSV